MLAKRILACTDFSTGGNAAAAYAVELAATMGADVVLAHFLNGTVMIQRELLRPSDPQELETRRGHALARLEELARLVARPGVTIRCVCRHGDPHRDLARLAEEEGADLIVVGKYGHSGLARLFLGSVADSAIRNCALPVLAVSEGTRPSRATAPHATVRA